MYTVSGESEGGEREFRRHVPGVSWWSETPGPEVSAGTPPERHEERWSGRPQSDSAVQRRSQPLEGIKKTKTWSSVIIGKSLLLTLEDIGSNLKAQCVRSSDIKWEKRYCKQCFPMSCLISYITMAQKICSSATWQVKLLLFCEFTHWKTCCMSVF